MRRDDRAQSVQIGAILLFGVLILGLALAQTVVVPAENAGVEFNGYVETTEDLLNLRNDLVTAGTGGGRGAETVKTGVRYPSRAVLINPGPPVGSLRTGGPENVTVAGVAAVSGESDTTRGFWNTTARGPRNYTTRSLRFSPAYNAIDVPPIEVSGDGAYRLTDNGPLALGDRTFVSGDRITLVTVDGDIDAASATTAVGVTPASVATRSVTVTGTGSTFTLTVPVPGNDTAAAAAAWNASAAAASLRASPGVVGTAVNGSRVDVTFDGSRTYELRLARVVVHDGGNSGVDADTDPAYVVASTPNGTSVADSGGDVAVEVRDRYNNPVSNATVRFSVANGTGTFAAADGDGLANETTVSTGADGAATVRFDVDDSVAAATVLANLTTSADPWAETRLRVTRAGADGGGADGSDINPNAVDGLVLREATIGNANCGAGGNSPDCQVEFTLDNLDTDDPKNVTELRYAFYSVDRQSSGKGNIRDAPTQLDLVGTGVTLDVRGTFRPVGEVVAAGDDTTFTVRFEDDGGDAFDEVKQGDFFVVTALIDNDGDGEADESANYFVAPENP